ncbi:MAG: hypothetical protein ACSHX6_01040 [Akkermansiaceae bacterium]
MDDIGTVIVVCGVLGALTSGLILSARDGLDEGSSGWRLIDAFLFIGLISILRGVAKGVADVFLSQSLASLILVIIFFVSVLMIVVGL